jgi:peptidoglycan-N-acetylglucosamine deacetylase
VYACTSVRVGAPGEPPRAGDAAAVEPGHDVLVKRRHRAFVVGLTGLVLGLLLAAGSVVPSLAAAPSRVVSHGPTNARVIALTFDDAWDPGPTRAVFEILRDASVAATFFPTGTGVARDPALWRSIADAGYVIGNHTMTHPDLTRTSDEGVVAEIGAARRTIEQATGRPMAALLRPPYGLADDGVLRIADGLGFATVVLWDVSSDDWLQADPDVVAQRSLAGSNGSIVLLHAGPASTIAALPSIIAGYRARGFAFVTVPELLAD